LCASTIEELAVATAVLEEEARETCARLPAFPLVRTVVDPLRLASGSVLLFQKTNSEQNRSPPASHLLHDISKTSPTHPLRRPSSPI